MKVKKAIIPSAGLGTRFLPVTKAIPKEMLPILNKPAIQYVVEEAVSSGIEEILIVLGRGKNSIENYFDVAYELEENLIKKEKHEYLKLIKPLSNKINIYFIRQKFPNGLGHAISCGKSFIGKDPFAVLLPDDLFYNKKIPCLKQLIKEFEIKKASIFALLKVHKLQINKYGIIEGSKINNKLYLINNLIEKPSEKETKSDLAIMGRYVFTSKIFEMISFIKPDKNYEVQLTEAMKSLIKIEKLYGYLFEGKRYDTGYLLGYLETILEYGLRDKIINKDLLKLIKNIKFDKEK